MDQIEMLVEQAHGLFGETSIFEVFDLPGHQEIIQTLTEFYRPVDVGKVDQYIAIINQLRTLANGA
ncbi:MAG: hypothetical protein VR65_25720 [Desulfobulbaceae bacterium BRH_c16a]|nr:MAG: hypothetical protein VR65_25720 [Desulfobulbaceae bacterium BRH_c16a]